MGIGLLHTVYGLIIYRAVLSLLFQEKLFDTVQDGQYERGEVFWFMFFGFVLMILGGLVNWVEHRMRKLPYFLGWSLLAGALLGGLAMPVSGFWLMLVPSLGIIFKQRARRRRLWRK